MGDITRSWNVKFPDQGIYIPKSGNISQISELFPVQNMVSDCGKCSGRNKLCFHLRDSYNSSTQFDNEIGAQIGRHYLVNTLRTGVTHLIWTALSDLIKMELLCLQAGIYKNETALPAGWNMCLPWLIMLILTEFKKHPNRLGYRKPGYASLKNFCKLATLQSIKVILSIMLKHALMFSFLDNLPRYFHQSPKLMSSK